MILTFTQADVGSPITKNLRVEGIVSNYIIGVTLHRYEDQNNTMFRFIRASAVSQKVEKLVTVLQDPIITKM